MRSKIDKQQLLKYAIEGVRAELNGLDPHAQLADAYADILRADLRNLRNRLGTVERGIEYARQRAVEFSRMPASASPEDSI